MERKSINRKISKTASAISLAGVVLLIIMLFSMVGAFASINSDQNENAGGQNFIPFNDQNVAEITNYNVAAVANSDKTLNLNIDLFRTEYRNNFNVLVVKSLNGEKVVAPGTKLSEDEAQFTIANLSDVQLELNCDFFSEYNSEEIPLEFKMIGPDGKYYVGSETQYDNPLKINQVNTVHSLLPGQTLTYKFPWRWIFYKSNSDDIYDTFLGNLTIFDPVRITIGIKSTEPIPVPPEPQPVPDPGVWPPQTSDVFSVVLISLVFVALVALGGTLLWNKKRKEDRHV